MRNPEFFLSCLLQIEGADDNAAGSAAVLACLRAIVEAGVLPQRTLEFHWYAAEEAGLLGSKDVAKIYFREQVDVVAMVNFDDVAYHNGNDSIGIITDYGNSDLIDFLGTLVDEYLLYDWEGRACR